jgi:hypothetical protein
MRHPPATVGKPTPRAQVIHFFNRKLPGNLPSKTARALLGLDRSRRWCRWCAIRPR